MMSNFSFSSTEVLILASSFAASILLFIITNRSLLRDIKSFEFNFNHFLMGIVVSLSLCFVFFNWETEETVYEIYDSGERYEEVTIPLIPWIEKKKELKLPPPDKKEAEVVLPKVEFKVKTVDKLIETIEMPISDQEAETSFNVDSMMTEAKAVQPPPQPPTVEDEDPVIAIAEQMPRFPGCEDLDGSNKEKADCANQQLLKYIYDNLKYPQMAIESVIEGQVVLRFVVEKDGSVTDVKTLRDIGGGCGNAAMDAVESMNSLPEKWTPGRQRGRAVRVQYTLPIKFKLQ